MKGTLLATLTLTLCLSWSVGRSQGALLAYSGSSGPAGTPVSFETGGQDDATVIFYPNPVKNYLNVKFPEKGSYTVKIYNIVGEKITEKSVFDEDLVRVNLTEIQNGMYFLSYELNGHVVTKTFSKTQ